MRRSKTFLLVTAAMLALALLPGCARKPEDLYQRGMKYLEKHEYRKAALELTNAVRQRPDYVQALYALGIATMELNQYAAAKRYLETAERLEGAKGAHEPDIALRLGLIAFRFYEFKEARKRAEWVLERQPANDQAKELLVLVLTALSEPESAEHELDRWVAANPHGEQARELRAGILLRQNKAEAACRELEQAAAGGNPSAELLVALGNLYQITNRPEEAERTYNLAIQKYPAAVDPRRQRAWLYARQGQRERAESEFRDMQRSLPGDPEAHGALASYYMDNRQWPQAIAELERLAVNRKDLFNRRRLAAAYLLAGRRADCARIVQKLLGDNASDSQARLLSGILALQADDVDTSINEFSSVVRERPDSATARFYLGVAFARQAKQEEAERNVQQALLIEPGMLEARLWLADAYLRSGATDSALMTLGGAPEVQQNLPPVRLMRCLCYIEKKDDQRALEELRALRAQNPKLIPDYFEAALAQLFGRHPEQARKSLEGALKEHPEAVQPLSILTHMWITQGRPAEAAARIEKQIAAGADSAAHYDMLGDAHRLAGNYTAAKNAYQRAAELQPDSAQEQIRLAQTEMALGNAAAARAQLQRVVGRWPKSSLAWTLLGRVYETEKNIAEATKAYEKAALLGPGNALAANNLAWRILSDHGDLARAARFAKQARKLDPRNATYADTLGWIHYKSGNVAFAYNELQEAVRLGASPTFLYHYGVVQMDSHRDKEALASLQAALKMDPKFKDAEDALNRVDLLKDRLELAEPGK